MAASRSFTFSFVVHVALVILGGGVVLFKAADKAPDFSAGSEGFLIDPGTMAPPPEPAGAASSEMQFTPALSLAAAPLSMLATTSTAPAWTAETRTLPVRGVSDSFKNAMNAVGKKMPQGGSGGAMGKMGGTRSGTIFGRKIVATKLGVILDVSGSAHPHLAEAIAEIQKGFADATMILYPGCGLTEPKGASGFSIRKYSGIPPADLKSDIGEVSTASVLSDLLAVTSFKKMVENPTVRDALLVSWYEEKGANGVRDGSMEKLIGQTQVAFDELFKRRVDTIYWFSDFLDRTNPQVITRLTDQLRLKRVVLHLHNFAGGTIDADLTEMAKGTGGTIDGAQ